MLFCKRSTTGLLVVVLLTVLSQPVQAALGNDLQALVGQADGINTSLVDFSFTGQTCSDLGLINSDIQAFVNNIETIQAELAAPLSIGSDELDALDSLSTMAREMAANGVRLSLEVDDIEDVADLVEYRAALSAMLELSDDIGTMADRILEMADRILAMADNISTMADRILISQQLQNANVALTQAAILTTQQNMVALSDSLSSIIYNVTLGQVADNGENLVDDMAVVSLSTDNMAQELERLQATTSLMVTSVVDLYTWMSVSSQDASHSLNGDTLTYFGHLSAIYAGLASSLEVYSATIEQLAPLTDTVILADATAAMLRLSADIGVMAGRIMEMSDKIIVMADNIGVMADRIVATQELQQANIELTQSSLLTAQNVTLTVIRNMGL